MTDDHHPVLSDAQRKLAADAIAHAKCVDENIRRAAGRRVLTPAELAARDAGLPLTLAPRLRGASVADLRADAVRLAADLGREVGRDFNQEIRDAARSRTVTTTSPQPRKDTADD